MNGHYSRKEFIIYYLLIYLGLSLAEVGHCLFFVSDSQCLNHESIPFTNRFLREGFTLSYPKRLTFCEPLNFVCYSFGREKEKQ